MRVYVAASYAHKDEAEQMMRMLASEGHIITHRWVYETLDGVPEATIRQFLISAALADLNGVAVAEALVVLHFPENKGTLVEFGYALGDTRKIIVVVDGNRHYTEVPIFYYIPRVHHEPTKEAAVDFLTTLEKTNRK